MKKVVIVGAPIAIIITLSYASIAFLSQASDATFAFEQYFDDESSNKTSESDYINSKLEGTDLGEAKEDIVFTVPAKLDTTPSSITALVNKELSLPSDYIPEDLVIPNVYFNISYFDEKKQLRSEAAKALEELFGAAVEENLALCAISGYRSYQRQYDIFTNNVLTKGMDHTSKFSAVPGYSEHQTGLSMDVSTKSVNYRIDSSFAETPEGKWLAKNAHLYGYIIRYPEGKSNITGYSYESWHIRYVGKDLAAFLYKNDLTLEEFYGFEPSYDYSDSISYDSLVDYGIDLDDVTRKPKVTPVVTEEEKKEEKEPSKEKDKDKDKKEDEDKGKEEDTGKDDSQGDKEEDGNTGEEEDKPGEDTGTGQEPGDELTPTPTPDPFPDDDSEGSEGDTTIPPDSDNNEEQEPTGTPTITPSPSVTPSAGY